MERQLRSNVPHERLSTSLTCLQRAVQRTNSRNDDFVQEFWFRSNAVFTFRLHLRSCYNRPNEPALFPVLEVVRDIQSWFTAWPAYRFPSIERSEIEQNPWIEVDWVKQSNEIEHRTFFELVFRTNRSQSSKSIQIELNPLDSVRLSSATEHN